MRLVADENMVKSVVDRLRLDGHTVFHVKETKPGISDKEVIDLAIQESAVILTADKDFGELVFRHNMGVHGVILVRLPGTPSFFKAELIARVLTQHAGELLDSFTVIAPRSLRIRNLKPK